MMMVARWIEAEARALMRDAFAIVLAFRGSFFPGLIELLD
jgi:hypothetical protein